MRLQPLAVVLKNLHRFEPRGEGALQAYMRQAVVNRVRNVLRRAGRRPAPEELNSDWADSRTSPLEALIGVELLQQYEQSLARLPPEARDAIVGRVEWRLTYAELATILGKSSPDAARMVVGRAVVRLAREMGRTVAGTGTS